MPLIPTTRPMFVIIRDRCMDEPRLAESEEDLRDQLRHLNELGDSDWTVYSLCEQRRFSVIHEIRETKP